MQRAQEREEWANYLGGQVGLLSYDMALSNWGPPISTTEGDEIFISQWGSEKSAYAVVPTQYMIVGGRISHGWVLQLTFNKKTKKMVNWSYKNW